MKAQPYTPKELAMIRKRLRTVRYTLASSRQSIRMCRICLRDNALTRYKVSRHDYTCGKCAYEKEKMCRPKRTPTPERRAWSGMIDRCSNSSASDYKNYGGRGISVCKEWRESFSAFLDHIGMRPEPTRCLDRINNDGNYEPGNVRWATVLQSQRNRRNCRMITVHGVTACMSEWSESTGLSVGTIEGRLRLGWSEEKAVSAPYQRNTPSVWTNRQ